MGLLTILQNLNLTASQRQINFLVEKSFKISLSYLRHIHKRIYKLLSYEELSFEDIAIDAIGPLFVRNDEEEFYIIKSSFENWNPPVKSEEDALFFLNKIIANKVEQHITIMLKDADPFFGKILDSVNYLIKKDEAKKESYLGRVFIIEKDQDFIQEKIIDPEKFNCLPLELFRDRKNLLQNVFQYLKNEICLSPAIPLNQLVQKLKCIYTDNHFFEDKVESFAFELEVDELIKAGLNEANGKLIASYLNKGKLNKKESENLFKSLQDMAEDLKDGGVNPGLYDYLSKYMVNLSKEEYQNKYHNILEYLFKVMKITIKARMS